MSSNHTGGNKVVEEWKRLLKLTDVEEVCTKIKKIIDELEGIETRKPQTAYIEQTPKLISTSTQPSHSVLEFKGITDFAWDQTNNNVKVYVTVPGVHTLPKENIQVVFGSESVELKVFDLHNKNHRLFIKKLSNSIKETECSYKVKVDSVTLTLVKLSTSHWSDLAHKDAKLKKKGKSTDKSLDAAGGDPGASIMNLMKDLYEEGDDDMKRTIAKAWTEANDKKCAGGGLSGGSSWGDMPGEL